MGFHDEIVTIRLKIEYSKKIQAIVKKHPDKYDTSSHFVRVAIIKLLREENMIPKENVIKSHEIKKIKK